MAESSQLLADTIKLKSSYAVTMNLCASCMVYQEHQVQKGQALDITVLVLTTNRSSFLSVVPHQKQ